MDPERIDPALPRGFQDTPAGEVVAKRRMVETVRAVYERYGFEPLDTPAVEFVSVLGKFLPESGEPQEGIFSFKDDDERWLALRYDLTAPLSRVVAARLGEISLPFRRYQIGSVWRREKPGPGRYREFTQFDVDTVGSASMAADAEVCEVVADALEALGIRRGDYLVKISNRKVLNGLLESIGLAGGEAATQVLRTVDKIDRLGVDGVRALLAEGRRDETGAFTKGVGLRPDQAAKVLSFVGTGAAPRKEMCERLGAMVGESKAGAAGVAELREIDALLGAAGFGDDRVVFDPGVVRGLEYYTGPVFEATLTMQVADEKGRSRAFGSVAGGGRYDGLVGRFTDRAVPATGISIGVDRLLAALRLVPGGGAPAFAGPVVVTAMDRARLPEYAAMVAELRAAGIAAELFLGEGKLGAQVKYADRRNSPLAVIAGEDEFARGEVTLKDLHRGKSLSAGIADRDAWKKGQPAQQAVPRKDLVAAVRRILGGGA